MDQKIISHQQLKEFVEQHKLMNSNSIVQFHAIVNISTPKDKITNKSMRAMITFNGYDSYGELTLLDGDLDPNAFPTLFKAKYQIIKHIDKEYLEINDIHPKIGKYNVKIIPLEKVKD